MLPRSRPGGDGRQTRSTSLATVEREQPRAFGVRADDVVIGQVFAVGARLLDAYIRYRLTRMLGSGRRRPIARQGPDEPHEVGVVQRIDDELLVGRVHRQTLEDLLIVDELRAGSSDALNDEVELVECPLDAIVVDGNAQVLAAAGLAGLQTQHFAAGWDLEHCAGGTIGDSHDDRHRAAVPKEMLHRQRDETEGNGAAEDAAEFLEALDEDGLVQRTALGATDERDDRGRGYRNNVSAVVATF